MYENHAATVWSSSCLISPITLAGSPCSCPTVLNPTQITAYSTSATSIITSFIRLIIYTGNQPYLRTHLFLGSESETNKITQKRAFVCNLPLVGLLSVSDLSHNLLLLLGTKEGLVDGCSRWLLREHL
ncbi:Hypothetical protein PP7435_CHR1-2269 [Komagataella phaffii CBS 7435]|uniref:Uncharacterized protein n=1 Tax=Komagataella phaffii (strain ATCC 76273 / CBS 7435 / CECT 11047 / NRRL Y-11430 / Wegner 21-1) TaxID=981350 RepID=A0A1G4KP92_KOMPC|nr:Hypothetical protein BQ9382_C1-3405 [Komagataella phaffii CBS 7435]SCV11831.1 Hypothetical protein PP7435_CHR1-2269 [Komagataella phaffii CBS 7435]